MKKIILGCLLTTLFAVNANADSYHLFIFDVTGSMSSSRDIVDDEGNTITTSRLDAALRQASKFIRESATGDVNMFDETGARARAHVKVIGFSDSFYGTGNISVAKDWGTNDTAGDPHQKISADALLEKLKLSADGGYDIFLPSGNTPLADVMCAAKDDMASTLNPDSDQAYIYLYTDGDENASTGKCKTTIPEGTEYVEINKGAENSSSPYWDWTWTVDVAAKSVSGGAGQEWYRDWFVGKYDYIWNAGRTYFGGADQNLSNATLYDWSGGVKPGSWSWLVYYALTGANVETCVDTGVIAEFGDATPICENASVEKSARAWNNRVWPVDYSDGTLVAQLANDFIFNVVFFYNDDIPYGSMARTSSKYQAEGYIPESESDFYINSRGVASGTVGSGVNPIYDFNFLSSMANITNGKVIPIADSRPMPKAGDVNGDGIVGKADLDLVNASYAVPAQQGTPSYAADVNMDNFVDNGDIIIIRNNWSDTVNAAPIEGDVDYSGCVSEADITQIMQWYNQPTNPGAQHSFRVDLNADDFIDDVDLAITYNKIGEGCGAAACTDGRENNDETDIDCGGDVCQKCVDGKDCLENADCLSNKCEEFVCEAAPPANLTASVVVTNTWNTGYCANIVIKNNRTVATKSWNLVVNMNGGSKTGNWNSYFSRNTGNATVTPMSYNKVIGAGQTISSAPGFCANRPTGAGIASVVSATGIY